MNVLIVGRTSMVSRALAARLHGLYRVHFAARKDAEIHFDLFAPELSIDDVDTKYHAVVHCAADFGGTGDLDLVRAEQANSVGAINVCRLAHAVGAKHLTLISSLFATYGPGDPFFGSYALSKRHAEENAKLFCDMRNISLAIIRPSQLYDKLGASRKHQPFFWHIVDLARLGRDITLFGSQDARRNFLNVDDLAEILFRVITRQTTGSFIAAHPSSTTLSELALAAFNVFSASGCKVLFDLGKADMQDLPPIVDFSLYDLLGYEPATDLVDGLAQIKNFVQRAL